MSYRMIHKLAWEVWDGPILMPGILDIFSTNFKYISSYRYFIFLFFIDSKFTGIILFFFNTNPSKRDCGWWWVFYAVLYSHRVSFLILIFLKTLNL